MSFAHEGLDLVLFHQLLLKATLVLTVALMLDVLLRRRFVLTCAMMWNATLVLLAALPLASELLPTWRMPVAEKNTVVQWLDSEPVELAPSAAPITSDPTPIPQVPAADLVSPSKQSAVAGDSPSDRWWPSGWVTVQTIYVAGCMIALLRFVAAIRATVRLRRSSLSATDTVWIRALQACCQRCGVKRPIELRTSEQIHVPVLLGWRRPAIVLPADLATAPECVTAQAILTHELAHVVRGDFAWQILLRSVRVVLWFHPLMWLAQRRIGFICERACDAFTIHCLGNHDDYVATLLDMASRLTQRGSLALGLAAVRSTHLGERLAAMRDGGANATCQAGRWLRLAAFVGALLLGCWLGRTVLAEPRIPKPTDLPADAQELLSAYESESSSVRAETERRIAAKRADLESRLKALQSRYTRSDDLDTAVAVRDQIRLIQRADASADRATEELTK
jgi:beta-lactamase regulating signal transducer with metallopeptidase domain